VDRVVRQVVVDFQVEVDEDVAESHPALETLGKIVVQDPLLAQDLHGVLVVAGLAKPHVGDHVLRHVEHALGGQVEKAFGEMVPVRIPEVLFATPARERSELNEVLVERAQTTGKHVLIDHWVSLRESAGACPR